MNIKDLFEDESEKLKNQWINDGYVFEKTKIKNYDEKFFNIVTFSHFVIKFLLFCSVGLYILFNIFCILLSVYYKTFHILNIFAPVIVCAFVFIISFSIFNNINVNKKVEEEVLYIMDNQFIFNFNNGIVETPKLFYSLSYDSIQKIEFIIYRLRKSQWFGSVTFTFLVSGYEVTHTIPNANLSQIKECLKTKFPSLRNKLIIDGKNKDNERKVNHSKARYFLTSFGLLVVGILFIVIPYFLKINFISLKIFSVIFFVTAFLIFLSPYLYTYSFVHGTILSLIFLLVGYLIPLIIIEGSSLPFLFYVANNTFILMPTFFGNIGLCFYISFLFQYFSKIIFKLKMKNHFMAE